MLTTFGDIELKFAGRRAPCPASRLCNHLSYAEFVEGRVVAGPDSRPRHDSARIVFDLLVILDGESVGSPAGGVEGKDNNFNDNDTSKSEPASFVESIAANRSAAGKVLLVVGTLLVGLTLFWTFRRGRHARFRCRRDGRGQGQKQQTRKARPVTDLEKKQGERSQSSPEPEFIPVAIGTGLLAAARPQRPGAIAIANAPSPGKEVYETRIALVVVGGTAGLWVTLLGCAYALRWQQSIVRWVNNGDLHEARWVLLAMTLFLAGLALMFVAMQPARAEERSSVILRRLLYGTNSVLTGSF